MSETVDLLKLEQDLDKARTESTLAEAVEHIDAAIAVVGELGCHGKPFADKLRECRDFLRNGSHTQPSRSFKPGYSIVVSLAMDPCETTVCECESSKDLAAFVGITQNSAKNILCKTWRKPHKEKCVRVRRRVYRIAFVKV